MNTKIEELLQQQKYTQNNISEVELEIKTKTEELQKTLANKKEYLIKIDTELNNEYLNFCKDKENHILDRYGVWRKKVKKIEDGYMVEDGPILELISDSYVERHEDCCVTDAIENFLYEINDDIEKDGIGLYDIKKAKQVYEELDQDKKQSVTELLEDAIKQNKNYFKYDW